MTEEGRFFLRTGLYAAVIGVVYWFVSYEVAGSVLLAAAAFAGFVVVGVLVIGMPDGAGMPARPSGSPTRRALRLVNRLLGFRQLHGLEDERPFSTGTLRLPGASSWPIVTAFGATLALTGIVYGPWLTIPGIVLVAVSVWGWVTS